MFVKCGSSDTGELVLQSVSPPPENQQAVCARPPAAAPSPSSSPRGRPQLSANTQIQSHTVIQPGCVTLIIRYASQILCWKEKYLVGFQQQLRDCVDRGFCASLCSLFFLCALILSVLPRVLLVPLPLHLHLTAVQTLDTKEKVGIRRQKKKKEGRKKREKKKEKSRKWKKEGCRERKRTEVEHKKKKKDEKWRRKKN